MRTLVAVVSRILRTGLLVLLLAGVPYGLVTQLGSPLPDRVPGVGEIGRALVEPASDDVVLNALAVALWVVWAAFAVSVVVEVAAALRGVPAPRLRPIAPMQTFVGWLVAGLLVAAPLLTIATTAPPAPRMTATAQEQPVTAPVAANTSRQPPVYQVAKGDWLGNVAERYLGDFNRYPDIQDLNTGLIPNDAGPGGPDHIEPGWRLALPADAQDRGPRPHATGQPVAETRPEPPATQPPVTQPPATQPPDTQPPDLEPPDLEPPGAAEPAQPAPSRPAPSASSPAEPGPAEPGASSSATGEPDPDGVVPEPGGTSPGRGETSPSRMPAASAEAGPTVETGVEIPGGWLTVPLAAAVVAAAALVWRRRRHRFQHHPAGDPDGAGDPSDDADLQPLPTTVGRLRHAVRTQAPDLLEPRAQPLPSVTEYAATDAVALPEPGPDGPALAGMDGPAPAGGLGLVGPGAESAARALLVATLSTGTPDDPDARGQVIIPADTLTTLLGAAAVDVGAIPRLHLAANLSDALTRAEELLIERRRLLEDHEAADLAGMRAADPFHPPMPPVLLLCEPPPAEHRARLTTALHLGAPLQISAVMVGEWPRGETVSVRADGRTDGERLAVVDVPTAVELLGVVQEAQTGEPAPAVVAAGAADLTTPSEPSPEAAPVRVRLLGEPAIIGRDGVAATGLRHHSRELLVYLAVHRSGAKLSDIMEAFWPTATVRRAGERLSTETSDLRRRIRQAAGDSDVQPVVNTGGHYHLNPDVLDIDVWRLADDLHHATAASDPDEQIASLRRAIDAHAGVLAEGHDYDWIDQPRELLRRNGVRARLRLADLLGATDPHAAVQLTQEAAALDPLSEDVAQRAMRALAAAGDGGGVRAQLERLRAALDEIDLEPTDETLALAARLQHAPS